jgi:hypothetical protein
MIDVTEDPIDITEDIARNALARLGSTFRDDDACAECEAELRAAQEALETAIDDAIRPGLREWISVRLGLSKAARVARRHLNRKDRLRLLMIRFLDASSNRECAITDAAFLAGFKAGVRFRSSIDSWASQSDCG